MPNTDLATTEITEVNPPRPTQLEPSPAPTPEKKDKRFLCRHLFADGRRCGSPALRDDNFCYYHANYRISLTEAQRRRRQKSGFDLTLIDGLDNPGSIQVTVAELLRSLAANTIDPKRAALILYGLQVASQNLRRMQPVENSQVPEEVVHHYLFGPLASMEPGRIDPHSFDPARILRDLEAGNPPDGPF